MQNQSDVQTENANHFSGNGMHSSEAHNGRDCKDGNGSDKLSAMFGSTAQTSKRVFQKGVEAATQHARDTSDRLRSTFGLTGDDGERLAKQMETNTDALTAYGSMITKHFQEVSQRFVALSQKQWQRNLDYANRLAKADTAHEFIKIQSSIFAEEMQNGIKASVGDMSLKIIERAGEIFQKPVEQSAN